VKIIKADGLLGSADRSNALGWPEYSPCDYGGESDLWDESWTLEDINDPNFGVVISAKATNSTYSYQASVYDIRITVYYTDRLDETRPTPTFLPSIYI